ncbi:MAG TPA: CBS domain-containing protein [Gemmatimonadales bacterium]|nr:CBS domain-containing protein [Gemmatimonadales bacterium]
MTSRVFVLHLDKKLIAVQEIMRWAQIRHIPVVDRAGALVGVISHRDLLHAAVSAVANVSTPERNRHLATIPISSVMRTDVQTIAPDAPIQEAARRMRERKIGCLPVVEGGKLVGIISEYDLLVFAEKT